MKPSLVARALVLIGMGRALFRYYFSSSSPLLLLLAAFLFLRLFSFQLLFFISLLHLLSLSSFPSLPLNSSFYILLLHFTSHLHRCT